MAIGKKVRLVITRGAGGSVQSLEKIEVINFNHAAGFITSSSVTKEDVSNSEQDRFVVETYWAEGTAPEFVLPTSPATTMIWLVADAVSKVNAKFPGTFV